MSQLLSTNLGPVRLIGDNATPIWGMSNAERNRRMAQSAAKNGSQLAPGHELLFNLAYAFDPLLLNLVLDTPGTLFTWGDAPIVGQVAQGADPLSAPHVVDLSDGRQLYNRQLRKLEQPMVRELTPASRREIERRSYFGAYKGVTDLLTKYLWPELALVLTRIAAQLRMTPNMVSVIGVTLCVVATFLFAKGLYWTGFLSGFIFMVLDTVDGKLARCTITSSKWGNVIDHGVDLVHPPFWWYFWGTGLVYWGLALSDETFAFIMTAVIAGYVLQRVIEGLFLRSFKMHIHVWRRFDSQFRLITARRNPNMVILFVALLAGRPDIGLVALAWWTIISLIVHAVRLAQAYAMRASGRSVVSWMDEAEAALEGQRA
ncbi:MAG: CDP-alcohol phosphatidyltransferase family protein [Pseudomonadota bacterium]|nr:CDP-alcohol phosphatidyltransferase family protein [Sphingobium naphthae]MEC7930909.1 CDP-alcohol phosphatidyltransferase family protein [Pseudomonadota bacterium]MEC8035735.1 CDP-alcohol phosphatidyltransferase family protein [Pseudomonadota bacterium]